MTNFKRFLLATPVIPLFLTLGCRSRSKVEDLPYVRTQNYKYADLIVKDYDEMHDMVTSLVRKAQKESDDHAAVELLQSALKLTFSRPDGDNMVSKLVPEVRRELVGYGAYEKVVAQLAAEAVDNIKNDENTVSVRTTSSFILENLLAEIRPEAERDNVALRDVVRRVADADVELTRDVRSERKLRGMYQSFDPSDEAAKIIKGIADREKAAREKNKK